MKKPTKKAPTQPEALEAYEAALHKVIDLAEVSGNEKSLYFRRQLARDMVTVREFIVAAGK